MPPYEAFLSGEPLVQRRTRYTAIDMHMKPLLMDADVVVFCEMFRHTFPTDQPVGRLTKRIQALGYHVVDTDLQDGSAVNSGLVVASKHAVVASAYHRFEASVGDELLAAKGFYEVLLAAEDASRILVYATHMQAHRGEANALIRQVQLAQIRAAMNDADQRFAPTMIVMMGDLNIDGPLVSAAINDHVEYVDLIRMFPEFTDTALQTGGSLATWDPVNNTVIAAKIEHQPPKDPVERTRLERLDYIFVASQLAGTNVTTRVVRPRFRAEDGIRDVSDHYGVLATINIKPPIA